MILGTFELQLGYHLTWALDSSWRSTVAVSTYSAAILAKIASRFLTALSNVSNVHLCSCPLMRFCTLNLEPWRWIPFMFTCSVCTPQQMQTTHHKGCNGSQVLIRLCTFQTLHEDVPDQHRWHYPALPLPYERLCCLGGTDTSIWTSGDVN